jgi:hypothetical protein
MWINRMLCFVITLARYAGFTRFILLPCLRDSIHRLRAISFHGAAFVWFHFMASPSCDFVSWCHFRVIIIDVVVLLVFCGSQDKKCHTRLQLSGWWSGAFGILTILFAFFARWWTRRITFRAGGAFSPVVFLIPCARRCLFFSLYVFF